MPSITVSKILHYKLGVRVSTHKLANGWTDRSQSIHRDCSHFKMRGWNWLFRRDFVKCSGFAKTFFPSLVIWSDEAGVLRQTFWVFVSHFTLKMAHKYDYFAGHFVWRFRSSSSDIVKICLTCLTWLTDFAKPEWLPFLQGIPPQQRFSLFPDLLWSQGGGVQKFAEKKHCLIQLCYWAISEKMWLKFF